MKITVQSGTATPVVLGDDEAEHFVSGYRPKRSQAFEVVRYPRAAAVAVLDRNNVVTQITFMVTRQHATQNAAVKFQLEHLAKVPTNGLVTIEHKTNGVVVRQYLKGAEVEVECQDMTGVSTSWVYTLTGGTLNDKPV